MAAELNLEQLRDEINKIDEVIVRLLDSRARCAYAVGRLIRAGTVGHNEWKNDLKVGFGGFKQSGIGREGGIEGLHPFLEAKTMIFETMPSHVK